MKTIQQCKQFSIVTDPFNCSNDYSEFKLSNMGVEHLDRYLHQVDLNWEGLRQLIEKQDYYFSEVADANNPKQEDGLLRKRFWAIYWVGNQQRIIEKFSTLLLYIIGFVLFSKVLAQNIIFVIQHITE